MANFLQPPPQDFATEILWLTQRYITTAVPKKKPKNHNPNVNNQTLYPSLLKY